MRKEWLAFSYVCQVCLNSRHSNYALIAPLAKSPKIWPSRSTPCLHNAIDLLMRHHPTALSYSNEYYCDYWCPPWIQNNMNPLPFPLLKQEAAERPHVAQNALLQIIGSFPPSSLVACTDGSLTTNGSCSCAVFIKDYTGIAKKTRSWIKHQLSWARRDTTSARIFPQSSQPTWRVVICSDSLSTVKAIWGFQRPFSHPSIPTIKRLANVIIMSGSKVSIIWIHSHVGIEGNEMADQLANSVHGAASCLPSTLRTANKLSRTLKLVWLKQLQDQLQLPNSPQSLSRAFRPCFFPSPQEGLNRSTSPSQRSQPPEKPHLPFQDFPGRHRWFFQR